VEGFLKALKARTSGRGELFEVRTELEQLLAQSPGAGGAAADALDSAHRAGSLPPADYRALLEVVVSGRTVVQRAPADPPASPSTAPASTTRMRSDSNPAPALDTDRRWEEPHTWTVAGEDPLFVGRILGRHYQLERKIGEGGMGVVYLAKDLVEADFSEQPFLAIKVLKPNFREHPDALKALHEEVRKSRALSHQNIVSVYTFDRDGTVVFMTMEYLEGKPLNELIDEDYARGMPLAQAWPIIEGAGRALAYAHDRGVVHSDFKPSNVFVTAGGRPKVLDFGIARAMRAGSGRKFDAGSLGALTELYASCEMLASEPADLRDDVYAYACVIYELLSGRHVFGGKSAGEARDAKMKMQPLSVLSKAQNRALARALAFPRFERTGSIEEIVEGLRPQEPRRRTASILVGAVGLAALLAGGGWWASKRLMGPNEEQVFVNSLLKPNASVSDNVDPEEIKLLMGQGDDYLAQAREHFDPAVLSEGVSTAYGAYRAVLRLDPANRPAAEKILEIVKLYESQAEALRDDNQFKRAATLIGFALKIDPNRDSLKVLQSEIEPKASSEAASSP
jgi:serine/threonine protein kinase